MTYTENPSQSPLVSICMPLFNEAEHLHKSILSIQNQTYINIEIIISDNSSTDDTFEICKKHAKSDNRIVLIRQKENIGAMNNFSAVLSQANGKYFMWASGHDLWSANLVEECVKILENKVSTVLAYGKTVWIDNHGLNTNMSSGFYDTENLDFAAKFATVMWGSMNPILGVIRKNDMPKLDDKHNYVGSDLVLLLSLILKGDFSCATSATFYRRQNRPPENHSARLARYKSATTKIAKSRIDKFSPLAKLPFMVLNTIIRSKLKLSEKAMLLFFTIPSLIVKYLVGKKVVR